MFKNLFRSSVAASLIIVAVCPAPSGFAAVEDDASAPLSPREAAAVGIAERYVGDRLDEMELTSEDVSDLVVSDVYTSRHNDVTHVYFLQRHAGIDIHNALINVNVLPDGEVLHSGNRAFGRLSQRSLAVEPRIGALAAVDQAASAAGLVNTEPFAVQQQPAGADRRMVFSDGGISLEPIPARLVYVDDGRGRLRLAWQVEIYERSAQHYWLTFVDAETGDIVKRLDLVIHDRWGDDHSGKEAPAASTQAASPARSGGGQAPAISAADGSQYRVFEMPKEHPNDGPRTLVAEPAHEPASPFGWHDTDGADGPEFTITRGNNAHAYHDRNDSNSSAGDEPDGGAGLSFDFSLDLAQGPEQYIDAAVTNLFYWTSLHHDLAYVRGFDEPAGNFQVNNYGNGGAGNDPVRSEAQDGADAGNANNANFFTPADGSAPRMQMFIWTQTTPNRDGDLDAGIVLHEYGHGISIRQTGGPSQSGCLSNTEQAGEGWSDWQSLIYTATGDDTGATRRGVGTYSLGQPVDGTGIREFPYSTDMSINSHTYADTQSVSVPHGVGSVWTAMLWEVYWNLIDEYGFNPDLYADWDQGGNLLAMQLVNDGLKLQPCSPGFVDGRDAILAADQALTGGANQCLIWEGFAKRGLGFSADQGSSGSNGDNVEAFDLPPACAFGEALPPEQTACTGDPVDFEIALGGAWTAPVDLSVNGHPGSAAFSQNPVTAPGNSTLTIDNTGGEAAGAYNLTVEGTDGTDTEQFPLALELFEQAPEGAALDAPADGALDVSIRPSLSWSAAPGATNYLVEIATDVAFTNIVHSATVEGLTHEPDSALSETTTHYWRVQPLNPCGAAAVSPAFSFTTANVVEVCKTPDLAIPDGDENGVDDVLSVAASGNILDLNAYFRGDHTWVGDLAFRLTHPEGSAQAMVVNRPGVPASTFGCDGDDFDLKVDDEGIDGPVETQCGSSAPALFGNPTPNEALSVFDGLAADGDWTLNAADFFDADPGTLAEWCLEVTLESVDSGSYTVNASVGDGNGSITPASQTVVDGDSASFTVTPDTGWLVDAVTGDTCSPVDAGGGTWTASNITADCAVTADFRIDSHTVTPLAGTGGSIVPSIPQAVDHGQNLQFTVTPDDGYRIDSVAGSCGGNRVGNVYTTDTISGDCTVEAMFEVLVDDVFEDRFEGQQP